MKNLTGEISMKRYASILLTIALLVSGFAVMGAAAERVFKLQGPPNASASHELGPIDLSKAFSYHPRNYSNLSAEQLEKLAAGTGLPLFQYNITATQDNNPYSGFMVGRSPFLRGKIPTSVPTVLVPLKIEFLDANHNVVHTFDPDAADPCVGGNVPTTLVANSPILNPANFTMNGVNVGNVQYIDGFQRANFWSLINGANYHTTLASTTHATVTVQVGNGVWATHQGSCALLGAIEINGWDNFVQTMLIPGLGLQPSELPIFFAPDVVYYVGNPNNCCVLGYHNAFNNPAQTYSISDFEDSGSFPATFNDTVVMSHEVGEWMDDPLTNNPTPAWGHIGQVQGCQNNLEVGDPLTPTNFPSVFLNGFTYHLQELAFFSWFYGGNLGAGGKYSNNGTFTSPSMVCH
jgi:hypothetical protein